MLSVKLHANRNVKFKLTLNNTGRCSSKTNTAHYNSCLWSFTEQRRNELTVKRTFFVVMEMKRQMKPNKHKTQRFLDSLSNVNSSLSLKFNLVEPRLATTKTDCLRYHKDT